MITPDERVRIEGYVKILKGKLDEINKFRCQNDDLDKLANQYVHTPGVLKTGETYYIYRYLSNVNYYVKEYYNEASHYIRTTLANLEKLKS